MKPRALEGSASLCLIGAMALTAVNLLAAQVLFGLAASGWLWLVLTDRQRTPVPGFAIALGLYAALTIASALLSSNPGHSVVDLKQLVLFLMVPMVMRLLQGDRAMRALNVVIAVGAAAALLGVVEYSLLGYDHLGNRPLGTLTHYMTYSGVIMLVLSAAAARLLFYPEQIVWPAVAVPALIVAVGATQTRGVWIGAAGALCVLVALKRPRLLWLAPVAVALAVAVTPAAIQRRALSIFDLNDPSNRDRLTMYQIGAAMVRDHPVLGVGPDMVGPLYGDYRPPDAIHPYNPHLHNVPVQVAAERGLPALAVWLAFVGLATRGLLQLMWRRRSPFLAASGLAATVAMLLAGLFEYNFGDSEFLMLYLALISLPFAAAITDGDRRLAGQAATSAS